MKCSILGIPIQSGTHVRGCLMGPDAYRAAQLIEHLSDLGHDVADLGNIARPNVPEKHHPNAAVHSLGETSAWISEIHASATNAFENGQLPIFLGGDHTLSAGTISAACDVAVKQDRPQFVLWLDAHPDLNLLTETESGNLHGTPMAYLIGEEGFENYYPPLKNALDPAHLMMMGIRSVDRPEHDRIMGKGIKVADMRAIDHVGVAAPLEDFLANVRAANGRLHVSLDVDFLEPTIASAVGTTVPGGATFREAHLIMEMVCESGLMTSLDMVELNPFLDDRGQTARLMVDLCGSLFGRRVLDRKTFSY